MYSKKQAEDTSQNALYRQTLAQQTKSNKLAESVHHQYEQSLNKKQIFVKKDLLQNDNDELARVTTESEWRKAEASLSGDDFDEIDPAIIESIMNNLNAEVAQEDNELEADLADKGFSNKIRNKFVKFFKKHRLLLQIAIFAQFISELLMGKMRKLMASQGYGNTIVENAVTLKKANKFEKLEAMSRSSAKIKSIAKDESSVDKKKTSSLAEHRASEVSAGAKLEAGNKQLATVAPEQSSNKNTLGEKLKLANAADVVAQEKRSMNNRSNQNGMILGDIAHNLLFVSALKSVLNIAKKHANELLRKVVKSSANDALTMGLNKAALIFSIVLISASYQLDKRNKDDRQRQ